MTQPRFRKPAADTVISASFGLMGVALAGLCAGCHWIGFGASQGSEPVIAAPGIVGALPGDVMPKAAGGIGPSPALGESCQSGDATKLCLGLKMVAYTDPASGAPTLSSGDAAKEIKRINSFWAQCNLGFQIDSYSTVEPAAERLSFDTANNDDLSSIRTAFATDQSLLVVVTGTWDRTGSLGSTGANAWTALPGEGPYGVVIEEPVATFPNIIAHELGHYLNLAHVSDNVDLMNPIIYPTSGSLTTAQCETARSAATNYWSKMLR